MDQTRKVEARKTRPTTRRWTRVEQFADIDLNRFAIANTKVIDRCRLTVFTTKNRSQAYLLAEDDLSEITLEDIEPLVKAARIELSDSGRAEIQKYIATASKEKTRVAVSIAKGHDPVNGEDSTVEWIIDEPAAVSAGKELDDGRVDYRERRSFIRVEPDQHLLTIHPPTKGTPGSDITGKELPAYDGAWKRPGLGDNVRYDDKQVNMYAEVDGVVQLGEDGRVHVRRFLAVNDVDFKTGNVSYDGDIQVGGSVQSGFKVEAGGSVSIAGDVHGAIISGHNVVIHGAVTGDSEIIALGRVELHRVEGATVRADEAVAIIGDAINLKLHCGGRLVIPKHRINGGVINALGGIEAGWLGGEEGDATRLLVDPDNCKLPALDEITDAIADRREKLERITSSLGALKDRPQAISALPPNQRNAIKRLLDTCSHLEFDLEVQDAERRTVLQPYASQASPSIRALRGISKGVRVTLKESSWTCPELMEGGKKINLSRDGTTITCESI